MAAVLSTTSGARSMSARAPWPVEACEAQIPTVGTNLTVHSTTGFGFKPDHQRPKEILL